MFFSFFIYQQKSYQDLKDEDSIDELLKIIESKEGVDTQEERYAFKNGKILNISSLIDFSKSEKWKEWSDKNLSPGVFGKIDRFLKQRDEFLKQREELKSGKGLNYFIINYFIFKLKFLKQQQFLFKKF